MQPGTYVKQITGNTVYLSKPLLGPLIKDSNLVAFSTTDPQTFAVESMWTQYNTDNDDNYMSYDEFKEGLLQQMSGAFMPGSIISCMFDKADTKGNIFVHFVVVQLRFIRFVLLVRR